jgi:hypothetical protein
MPMTDQESKAYALVALLGKEGEFAPKLDEMVKAREAAEAASKQAQADKDALDKATASSIEQIKMETIKFDAARVAHDETAEEARKRIDLNRGQLADLENVRMEVEKRNQSIALREAQVAQDLKRVESQSAQLRAAIDHVSRLKPALTEVVSISQSMKEALG